MIEAILTDLTLEILILLISGVVSLIGIVYKNRQNIVKIKHRLFGLNADETSKGYIKHSKEKIDEIDEKVDCLEDDVNDISHTVQRIENKIDLSNGVEDEPSYNPTDDD